MDAPRIGARCPRWICRAALARLLGAAAGLWRMPVGLCWRSGRRRSGAAWLRWVVLRRWMPGGRWHRKGSAARAAGPCFVGWDRLPGRVTAFAGALPAGVGSAARVIKMPAWRRATLAGLWLGYQTGSPASRRSTMAIAWEMVEAV